MKETAAPKRLALIDRDGTIIVDKVYLRDPDENLIEFISYDEGDLARYG